MPWSLQVWFGYSSNPLRSFDSPVVAESFDTEGEARDRLKEILKDGHDYSDVLGWHHHPACAITHAQIQEYYLA